LFLKGEARAYHAVATGYRDRSHFDGQNVLESGGRAPYALTTGWIGRLLTLLSGPERQAMALAPAVPLAMRGPVRVTTYEANDLTRPSDDLLKRVGALYETDPQLAPMWLEALQTKALTDDLGGNTGRNGRDLGKLAASLLLPARGARVMMIDTGGWDTHSGQKFRLAAQLRGLDALLAELKSGLGPVWKNTMVLVATEFGRTAAVNGTGGTDHGTASVAMLFGGGLPRGRPVVADWPGLGRNQLYENRDLRPTSSLGAVITSALADHYSIEPGKLGSLFAWAQQPAMRSGKNGRTLCPPPRNNNENCA
jgi:uncharacterized protein (DUF1501 family)